jgi:hypothetical protein
MTIRPATHLFRMTELDDLQVPKREDQSSRAWLCGKLS